MGWKIIEINESCNLKLLMDSLIVVRKNRLIVPIKDIDTLIISNVRINITINLINELSSNGVNLIFCDKKYIPKSFVLGINVKKQSYKVFQEQLKWSENFKTRNWNIICKKKIQNQLFLLKTYKYKTNDWNEIIDNENNFSNNYESQVANLFFHSLYGAKFNRDNLTEVNYILNYAYIILTSMVTRSIIKKGLHQHISFFHGSEYSQFPLAYDIVEVFRIIADYFVIELFNKGFIKLEDKDLSREVKHCFLDYISEAKMKMDNTNIYLNNAIDMFIDWIIKDELKDHTFEYEIKEISIKDQ